MAHTPPNAPLVEVAVAVVVENVSSLDALRPATTTLEALRALDRSAVRVLITLRGAERVLAHHWELPGGKLEADESPEQAVVRELREEVGVDVAPLCALDAVEHVYEHAHVRLRPFVCRRVGGLPRTLEVDAFRWVALDALGGYRFPEASTPVIDALLRLFDAG